MINQDCLEVLEDLYNEDFGVCLLNFASAKQPGGGVLTGATAQEEEICRRSNLMAHLLPYSSKAKQFNLKPKKQIYGTSGEWLIYSESVIFFKDKDYKSFIESRSPFDADVISCSAPNRNNPEPKEGWEIFTKRKMRNILRTAINRGNDALVLGAWGCGVFKNPPEEMAKWWHEVICEQEFYNRFRKIVFAILNDNNSVSNNYKIFKKEFR